MTEDIIRLLARNRWLAVISRHSTMALQRQPVDPRDVGHQFGVKYLVLGSVRKNREAVRISAELVRTIDGEQLWSETYDLQLESIFDVQEEMATQMTATIEPELSKVEQKLAARKAPSSLDAWDCYQRGLWNLWRFTAPGFDQAETYFHRALAADPKFARGQIGVEDGLLNVLRRAKPAFYLHHTNNRQPRHHDGFENDYAGSDRIGTKKRIVKAELVHSTCLPRFGKPDYSITRKRASAMTQGGHSGFPTGVKKIISRAALLAWWNDRLQELVDGSSDVSGAKLREKMDDASLSDDQIRMALELRRDYAQMMRTPRYMSENDVQAMQRRVKSELATLRAGQMAGELSADGATFHSLCLQIMDAVNQNSSNSVDDQSAFLKGCMYDIADRCLHRFTRQERWSR